MTRTHRSIHRLLWTMLAFTVAVGLTMALVLRPLPDAPAEQSTTEPRR